MKVLAPFHKRKLNGYTFYKNWWCGAYSGELGGRGVGTGIGTGDGG